MIPILEEIKRISYESDRFRTILGKKMHEIINSDLFFDKKISFGNWALHFIKYMDDLSQQKAYKNYIH